MIWIAFMFVVWIPILTVVRGLTLSTFWDWFVSGPGAAFYGEVPEISFVQALGLGLLVTLFTYDAYKKGEKEEPDEMVVRVVTAGIMFYGFAWIMALIFKALL